MSEGNKALARREVEEIFTQGKLDMAEEIYASDFVDHDLVLPREMHGPEEMKEYVGMYRSAFPDLKVTLEDQVAEGDKVVNRWTAQGTHLGEYMGIAPTGKEVRFAGIHISRIDQEGKIAENWEVYDLMGLMRQIGAVPTPEQS
ncbi:MAG: ester cyclase [Actinomycetota bacterium]|nr:ester cyclase [Actinomycetota bacterium]